MTPQLFINYKLKSVAHLPWKAMIYKSLNTFIDDLFAFVIKVRPRATLPPYHYITPPPRHPTTLPPHHSTTRPPYPPPRCPSCIGLHACVTI